MKNSFTKNSLGLFGCALMLLATESHATLLYSTNFNGMADGNLVGQGGWAAHSGAGSVPVQVNGGVVTLNQGSGSREDVNVNLGATMGAGDKWYYSFDVTVTGSASPVYFAHFLQGTTTFDGRLYITNFSGADFTFGIGNGSVGVASAWQTGFSFGSVNKVVVAYDFSSGDSTLWVNPVDESSTSITFDGAFSDLITSFAFRQASPSVASSQTIDNLNVGTTFADVVPVPEPTTMALATLSGLSVLGFSMFRRKK